LEIEIRLFANLAKLLPEGSKNKRAKITVRDDITVNELLNEIKIPGNVTNVIMVNGIHQNRDVKLKEGDVLSVIPPVTGG
jgi:molybdopterin synthase sulfur carrier subunit